MRPKLSSNLTLILVSIIIAVIGVAVSLQVPIHWENNPPKCCDIPNGGTYYGFPLPIRGETCCGITGIPQQFSHYRIAFYNFVIYFVVLLIIGLILKNLKRRDLIGRN